MKKRQKLRRTQNIIINVLHLADKYHKLVNLTDYRMIMPVAWPCGIFSVTKKMKNENRSN